MAYTKTSIFLFFLIIGTSVFPTGSSTGLAHAESAYSQTWNQLSVEDIVEHLRQASQQPSYNQRPGITYGSQTNAAGNSYTFKDIKKDEMKKPFNSISNSTGSLIVYSIQTYQKNKPNVKGDFKGKIVYGSEVESSGNTFYNRDPNARVVYQIGNTYSENSEANKDALKPVIHQSGNFYHSSNDSEAEMNTKNNTENQVNTAEQNATDSQGNSSSTNYDSSSHIENKTLYNKKSEAYANKHTAFNRQMSLSSNVFYSLSYSLIILLKYSLF